MTAIKREDFDKYKKALEETSELEASVLVAVWPVKSLLNSAREYWIEYQKVFTVEQQVMFWEYFDSQERTMLQNRTNGAYKPARRS